MIFSSYSTLLTKTKLIFDKKNMKFVSNSIKLLKELQKISGVLSTNNTLPILDSFLFELSENQLKVVASDLETTIINVLSVESNETGSIAIPAKILIDTLKAFSNQPLTFVINSESFGVEITLTTEIINLPSECYRISKSTTNGITCNN